MHQNKGAEVSGASGAPNYRSTIWACYIGYITQAIAVNLPPLFFVIFRESYGISYSFLATLILITFVVQIAVDAIMVKLTVKLGYRLSAVLAHVFSFLGLLMLGILPELMPSAPALIISSFLYSLGGGLTEVVISPIIDSLPGDAKASSMSLLHSFYSWGQMLVVLLSTPLLILFTHDGWNVIPILWSIVPFFNIFLFAKVPLVPISEEESGRSAKSFIKSPVFIVSLIVMICAGASEQAMSQWASLFAEKGLGVTKAVGDIAGPCLFALFMSIGRTFYGIKGEKIDTSKALIACACLTVVCYATAVFAGNPIVSLLGCAVCGLGVSLMWPGTLAYTSKKYNYKAGPVMFALLALGGDIGCSSGPWVCGRVSDLYLAANSGAADAESMAIKMGLAVSAIFPILMIFALIIMRKLKTDDLSLD